MGFPLEKGTYAAVSRDDLWKRIDWLHSNWTEDVPSPKAWHWHNDTTYCYLDWKTWVFTFAPRR